MSLASSLPFSLPRIRSSWTNNLTATLVFAIVALCPLMIGGNRPVFWMLNASLIFATSALYFFCVSLGLAKVRVPLRRIWPLSLAILVYLFGVTVHTLLSTMAQTPYLEAMPVTNTDNSVLGLVRIWSYALLFYLSLQVASNPRRRAHLAKALAVVVAGYTLYSLMSWRDPTIYLYEKTAYIGYVTGPFINRNSAATFLAFSLVFILSQALDGLGHTAPHHLMRRRRSALESTIATTPYLALVLLISAAILATGSRTGALVGLVGAVTVSLQHWMARSSHSGRGSAGIAIVVGVVFLGAVGMLYGGQTFERLIAAEDNADVRLALYRNVWQMVQAHPWWGVGFDNFEQGFQAVHSLPVSPDRRWVDAHNTYLELWSELGLILGSLPPVICAVAFAQLAKSRGPDQPTPPLARAAMAMIVVGAIHSLVDFSLEIEANVFLLIFVTALGLASTMQGPDKQTGKSGAA